MLALDAFAQLIQPSKTVLFLGAGASVGSGAPVASALAQQLCQDVSSGDLDSDDFNEACALLEARFGREEVVRALRARLDQLVPQGGLLVLASLDWPGLYTTNYDRLVEAAYARLRRRLVVVRSNFDYSKVELHPDTPVLWKLHGCLSQDLVDGHKAAMLLTERDLEDYSSYRESLFSRLGLELATRDVLIVGQSLADAHLKREVNTALRLKRESGMPGRIFLLSYRSDDARAALLESKGVVVATGDLEQLAEALQNGPAPRAAAAVVDRGDLPLELATTTALVERGTADANVVRLFNGSPARYGDILSDLTFARAVEPRLLDAMATRPHLVIHGVAGVGKTSLARSLLLQVETAYGWQVYEHRSDYPLKVDAWLAFAHALNSEGRVAGLLVDDCPSHLRQINQLAQKLSELYGEELPLRLLLTAVSHQWLPRVKSPTLIRSSTIERLTELVPSDLERLVTLVENKSEIRALVDTSFSRLPHARKVRHLRQRCAADMFVCLKNIFATDELDVILLREYAELSDELADVYRHVAALEATGTQVHRQLVVRLLGLEAGQLVGVLDRLQGIVEEHDVNAREGLYRWATRHSVIAKTITQYKFSGQSELGDLLTRVVESVNPAVPLELRTVRELCNRDYGISQLRDDALQVRLLEMLIEKAPAERIPRHRLVKKWLDLGDVERASLALRVAEEEVRLDPPLARFKVLVQLKRAEVTAGLRDEDRQALVRQAVDQARKNLKIFDYDRYAYTTYARTALQLAEQTGEIDALDDAMIELAGAFERLLEPELGEELHRLEARRERLTARDDQRDLPVEHLPAIAVEGDV